MKALRLGLVSSLPLLLSGCNWVVLSPSGDIAARQRDLLVQSTLLMLLIIVPVMAITILFAWKYRSSSKNAAYDPDWDHSTQLELVIWGGPLLIIVCLGAITWMGTHLLDPYRATDRIDAQRLSVAGVKPLDVQVVALDWKWLFIYPEYNIATVNELATPVDRPVNFTITSSSVMNAFYVPAMAGMIYAMPAMQTQLHAVLNTPGEFHGFSANYSGAGFSRMHFPVHSLDSAGFDKWVSDVKANGASLTSQEYLNLEMPSEHEAARHYGIVEDDLFHRIVNLCVAPGKMCVNQMMAIDARGGLGLAGIASTQPLEYDNRLVWRQTVFGARETIVANVCGKADFKTDNLPSPLPVDLRPVRGWGLASLEGLISLPLNSTHSLPSNNAR